MDQQPQKHRSQFFTVRVWQEDLGNGQGEWRGKVQHVLSGEASYFREWSTLIAFLVAKLTGTRSHQVSGEDEGNAGT